MIDTLPVADAIPALRAALQEHRAAVLQAPPGAGKTTMVPLALVDEAWLRPNRIVLLEPRRVAARAAAHRMAALLGQPVGHHVGYRTRTDSRTSAATRIEVVTEGILTRQLQKDPTLDGVGLLIFDEFHERNLVADLGLALALHTRALVRDDLRILVMSATLDSGPVARLLGDPPIVTSGGQMHAVETRHVPPRDPRALEGNAASAVRRALSDDAGDILVFLPGVSEINRTRDALAGADAEVLALHGMLAGDEQDRAISPGGARRRVVLATSIAETSLTIPGVRVVVDSGLSRRPRFSPRTGMTRLETLRVTRAIADQRRGRAGRTAPGVCYRLWPEHEELIPSAPAEMLEADLAPLALDLAATGIADPSQLRWIDSPPAGAFQAARELLRELRLLDSGGAITREGSLASSLPLHPRLAHMLVRARETSLLAAACDIAALLSERDFIRFEGQRRDPDLQLRLDQIDRGRRGAVAPTPSGATINRDGLHRIREDSNRLRRQVAAWPAAFEGHSRPESIGGLLACAYPDRVGRARNGTRGRYLLRNGSEVAMDDSTVIAGEEWVVVADLDGRKPISGAWLAAGIERDEIELLFGDQIVQRLVVEFDERDEAVTSRRLRELGAILLDDKPVAPEPQLLAATLADAMLRRGLLETAAIRAMIQRIAAARSSGLEVESMDAPALVARQEEWLHPALSGVRSLAEAKRIDFADAILGLLDYKARRRLDELAPTHFEVPTGSRLPIDYSDPEAPTLAVRIQEVFGLTETPRVGRLVLTLHLLSPAHRPVQVTRDLPGFWRTSYFEVRREMRGRYPKHPWPDDPANAMPTRRAKPRRQ